ncbi:hypothetical protein [Nocardioides sp. GY 10127]|uniref:hypothetical protein n=1 Tax=Nocardioides sp. GY 10127 TaxID=2569762 RepID=UPI0010A92612|nr:hypothetical protein [Nocardioides sp. GY 10127]TIC80704.1 hypothetical protein E8D37_12495 [Nocardioides sp. GY 10127]
MTSFWESLKRTSKALGGTLAAPTGVVLDLAQMPFDDKDDDFGSVVNAISSRAADAAGLMTLQSTRATGLAVDALNGANWLLDMGLNRPISTLATMSTHQEAATAGLDRFSADGLLASAAIAGHVWASPDDWAAAWKQSDDQNAGQSLANMLVYSNADGFDPLDYGNAYDERTSQEHPGQAAGISWGANIAGILLLDPTGLALKAGGVAVNTARFGELTAGERAGFLKAVTGGDSTLTSRTDNYLGFINGANSQSRALTAPEILAATPELNRYGTNPQVVAGLLADAQKLKDPALVRDTQRRVLAVAMGDRSQIARLESEKIAPAEITDALKNYSKGSVLDLTTTTLRPELKSNPAFIQHLENQIKNLDNEGSVQKFVDDWNGRIDLQTGTDSTLRHAPAYHGVGARALGRENNQSLAQKLAAKHDAVDAWAARRAKDGASASTVFQKSAAHVPLVVMRTAGVPMKVYTKAPATVSKALRQAHFTGVVNLDEWGRAGTELDSMMRLSSVADDTRRAMLNRVFLAQNETEKMKLIEEVEHHSLQSLAAEFNAKAGEKTGTIIDSDLIRAVMEKGSRTRAARTSAIRGRAYAATEQTPERQAVLNDTMRARNAAKVEDSTSSWGAPAKDRTWRVDEIPDESGMPVHLPLLETQLANKVPLLDIHTARKAMEREFGTLGKLSKAWKRDAAEFNRLWRMKNAGAEGLDRAITARATAMDMLVDSFASLTRLWKFSVLFRLGYPVRVLMDEEARIWARLGTAGFMGHVGRNTGEALGNLGYNAVGRRVEAERGLRRLQTEHSEIKAMLDDDLTEAWHARYADLTKLQRSVGGIRGQITKWRAAAEAGDAGAAAKADKAEQTLAQKEAHLAYLQENLGESPEQLTRRKAQIEEALMAGRKGLLEPKRHLGEQDITIDGQTLEGAYGGQYGALTRDAASSADTYEAQMRGVDDQSVKRMMTGAYRTIQPTEAGYLDAWADTLNYQVRNSPAAMFFLKGGSVEDFAAWVRSPEQAALRRRLPHFAADPEDWGHRIQSMLLDYVPNEGVRDALVKGRVSARQLNKLTAEGLRPAVHGMAAGDTLGSNQGVRLVGNALNNVMRYLSEVPTDQLSRHPYFVSMYRTHAQDVMDVRKAAGQTLFNQADLDDIARIARKRAMTDVRNTLFDLSAHSHAAHVMRFISPFFAAHQEALTRWWRLSSEDPSILRKIALAFDAPRYAGIVIDSETGEPVKPGSLPSVNHRILLQMPGKDITEDQSNWYINEAAFNLIMPQGPTNPGLGPIAQLPIDYFAKKYAEEPDIARLAAVFNPYPSQSTVDSLIPATMKRALAYGESDAAPGVVSDVLKTLDTTGIGLQEYNSALAQETQDMTVDFWVKNGREPTQAERNQILDDAANEASSRMFHRVLWNSLSPAPATPQSRYAVVQQGWYQIQEQARAEGKDFDWAYDRFKSKYGEAYLPLISSGAENPAGISTADSAWVEAIKTYKPVLQNVDPALTRAVIGGYAAEIEANDPEYAEYNQVARNWLRDEQVQTGSSDTYYSYADPRAAMEDAQVARGWSKYNALTSGLENAAEQMGLSSYEDSPPLVAVKRQAVAQLQAENDAWAADYGTVDSTKFDRYIADLTTMTQTPSLANDPTRTDIQMLGLYLAVRQQFVTYFEASLAAGNGGPDAASQAGVRAFYTELVDRMVRGDTQFQSYLYDGLLERDPLLLRSYPLVTAPISAAPDGSE